MRMMASASWLPDFGLANTNKGVQSAALSALACKTLWRISMSVRQMEPASLVALSLRRMKLGLRRRRCQAALNVHSSSTCFLLVVVVVVDAVFRHASCAVCQHQAHLKSLRVGAQPHSPSLHTQHTLALFANFKLPLTQWCFHLGTSSSSSSSLLTPPSTPSSDAMSPRVVDTISLHLNCLSARLAHFQSAYKLQYEQQTPETITCSHTLQYVGCVNKSVQIQLWVRVWWTSSLSLVLLLLLLLLLLLVMMLLLLPFLDVSMRRRWWTPYGLAFSISRRLRRRTFSSTTMVMTNRHVIKLSVSMSLVLCNRLNQCTTLVVFFVMFPLARSLVPLVFLSASDLL